MSNTVLIMGESGTGKSTSIRNLDPKETFIISVLDKPLPFKSFRKNYNRFTPDNLSGNYSSSDDADKIIKLLSYIDSKRPEIKSIVIDDSQYVMSNEYMRRSKENGFGKFVDIGKNYWAIAIKCISCRPDLDIFIMSHTEIDKLGRSKAKTIGKMIDEKIVFEGLFTVVLHSIIYDNKYKFLTQNDGSHIAKSPMDMFPEAQIDNDLLYIKQQMKEYNGDVKPEIKEEESTNESVAV